MAYFSTAVNQGRRPYQEDTHANQQLTPSHNFFGIFDGHGGGQVSAMCCQMFPEVIKQGILDTPHELGQTVHNSFYIVDNVAFHMNLPHVGSTAVFCLLTGDAIWFANAGDSMTMVGLTDGSSMMMSEEHKVEKEVQRIQSEGGLVTYFDGVARVNGNLNVSRAIGDHNLKKWVNCNPCIRSISSGLDKIKYILLASDGVWDVFNDKDLNNIVMQHTSQSGDKKEIIDNMLINIISLAQARGSTDNITVTYVQLK